MKSAHAPHSGLLTAAGSMAIALSLTMPLHAQDPEARHALTKDWITHHVVFSNPGTKEDAIKNGTYERWLKIVTDPRYIMQQEERSFLASAPSGQAPQAAADESADDDGPYGSPAPAFAGPLPRGIARALVAPPSGQALPERRLPSKNKIRKDWSEGLTATSGGSLGGTGFGTAGLGEFPATYQANLGTPSCANDFAVFNTGLASPGTQASIIAYKNLYASCNSNNPPTVYWAFNTGGTIVNSVAFYAPSNQTNEIGTELYFVQENSSTGAAQLVLLQWAAGGSNGTAINAAVTPTSVSAATYVAGCTGQLPCMTTVTLSGTGAPTNASGSVTFATDPNTWPGHVGCSGSGCKSSANPTLTIGSTTYTLVAQYCDAAYGGSYGPSCDGGGCNCETSASPIIYTVDQAGATDEEYDAQTLFAALWDTTAYCVLDSPDACFTGISAPNSSVQPTFSSNVTSLQATSAGPAGDFTVSTSYSTGMTVSSTSGTNGPLTDTYSSPYYDPNTDTIYVGDDVGYLHKFHPVFTSTGLAEVVTTGVWPAAVNTKASLGSPVYDGVSGNVFVGDYPINFASSCQPPVLGSLSPCGYLYAVGSGNQGTTSGQITASAHLDYNDGIIDSPIVDSSAGYIYAFVGQDNSTSCAIPSTTTGGPCAGVFQFKISSFAGGSAGTEAQVGAGSEFMMSGAFDNQYYSTGNGHLYVVGNTGPANNTLWNIPITGSSTMGTPAAGPQLATSYTNGYYAAGLQVTEYLNGSTDYIFVSVLAFGNTTTCLTGATVSIGCVLGFTAPSTGAIGSGAAVNGSSQAEGGSSGLVVDYQGTGDVGNIYFSTLLNASCTSPAVTAGCAIQNTQGNP